MGEEWLYSTALPCALAAKHSTFLDQKPLPTFMGFLKAAVLACSAVHLAQAYVLNVALTGGNSSSPLQYGKLVTSPQDDEIFANKIF